MNGELKVEGGIQRTEGKAFWQRLACAKALRQVVKDSCSSVLKWLPLNGGRICRRWRRGGVGWYLSRP